MILSLLLSLLAGSLLTLAFSPFNLYTLSFILPAVLLAQWLKAPPKKALWQGYFFGLGFFGAGVSWVYVSIHQFGNASIFLAAFITFLFIAFLALFPAVFGYIFKRFFSSVSLTKQCLLVFPALWTLCELLRSVILTGFPWLLLGYTQLTTPLSGYAPLFGIYGLTLITTLISGAFVLLFLKRSTFSFTLSLLIIFILTGCSFIFQNHAWTKTAGSPIQVSLIQGNIPQEIKWDPHFVLENINVYKQLTLAHLDSQLIVWPEGAFPIYAQDAEHFIRSFSELAARHHSNIIFGAPIINEKTQQYYNGLLLIGDNHGEYLKRHLVPFGEYTPLSFLFKKAMHDFHIPMSSFTQGPAIQKPLYINDIRIAPFICYEIAFPFSALNAAQNSAMLLTISDDGWFGRSLALAQHLQMAQMRSLETGRYQLLSTNTGITAFISPLGRIIQSAPIDQQTVLTADIPPMQGKTPLMRWHYYPVFLMIFLMLICAIF